MKLLKVAPYLDKAAWWAVRRGRIGSTDAAAILGRDEYSSPQAVWDRIVLGDERSASGADVRRGSRQEEPAAQATAEHLGLLPAALRRVPMVEHDRYPFLVTDVDREILTLPEWPESLAAMMEPQDGPGALEIKVPRVGNFYRMRDAGLPLQYVVQHQHHFLVTGWRWGVFAFFTPEYDDVEAFPVLRDDDFCGLLERRLVKWWKDCVVRKRRPERVDPPERWPKAPNGRATVRDDPAWAAAAGEFIDAQGEAERARMRLEAAQAGLVELLSPEELNVIGGGVHVERRRSPQQRRFDAKAFRAAVKLAQAERDAARLLELDADAEEFYYRTEQKERIEAHVSASAFNRPAEEEEEEKAWP